jgi:hypothetical protein
MLWFFKKKLSKVEKIINVFSMTSVDEDNYNIMSMFII